VQPGSSSFAWVASCATSGPNAYGDTSEGSPKNATSARPGAC
jgi:hypothetical protein